MTYLRLAGSLSFLHWDHGDFLCSEVAHKGAVWIGPYLNLDILHLTAFLCGETNLYGLNLLVRKEILVMRDVLGESAHILQ